MIAIKAVVKGVLIKPLEAVDLPEGEVIVVYAPKGKGEDGRSFFFPSAFDFWKDQREDLYYEYL